MKPFRLVPALPLKLVLLASFLLSLPCVSRAQMVTTATYTTDSAQDTSATQKAIAIGADGYTRFIVVEDGPPPDYWWQLTYVRCLDLACDAYNTKSWPNRNLSPYTFSLAIGPDGYARIAYQILAYVVDSAGEGHNATVGFIQCFDDDCASSTNDSFVDYAAQGDFASVAVGSDGTAYIAYDNGNVGDGPQGIGLATCSSGGCSTSTLVTGISVFDFTDGTIAIGSDGNPVVVYADDNFSYDPNSNRTTYMSSTGHYYENGSDVAVTNDASVNDLAIGPDGFARIYFQNHAYYDSTATPGAYFVQCGNVSCNSATVNPIALPGVNFASTGSLAVTADGTARAEIDLGDTQFYTDATYYVECTAADCSTYDSSLISADSGDSAGLTSIAAGSDGVPRMIAEDENGVVYQVRATCGDERDRLIKEYSTYGVNLTPVCSNFSQFTHSSYFSYNELRNGDDYTWALIRNPLVTGQSSGYGLDLWRTDYGSSRIINSGYRNPAHNNSVGGAAQSQHMYGTAADLSNQSGTLAEYNAMVTAATDANADFIEPTTGPCSTNCVHADWRAHDAGEYAQDSP